MRFFYDLKKHFNYLMFATKSQLKAEVTNAYLDWVWWILEPLCNMLVYTFIFDYVFHAAEQYFPIFVFIGVSMWGFFSKCLTSSVKLVKRNKGIITKVYIPKNILLLKVMCVNAVKMGISFMVIFYLMIIYKIRINICIVYAVPIIVILFIFTYGFCCFTMHYGVYLEDLEYIIGILLRLAMYFTGIFYDVRKRIPDPFGVILENGNPIAFLISGMRKALLYRQGGLISPLGIWGVISIVLAVLGTRIVYKNENSYVKVI